MAKEETEATDETEDETEEKGIQWKGKGETFQDMRMLEKWDDGCENAIVDQRKAVVPRGVFTYHIAKMVGNSTKVVEQKAK